MWQDYVGIVPGVAALAMGVVTLATKAMPTWKNVVIVALTVIAIGATGFSQWWTLHEKGIQEAQKREILGKLGDFIAEGQNLMEYISANSDKPIPKDRALAWSKQTEDFLRTLGNSYVVRFDSTAGLTSVGLGHGDIEHGNWWLVTRAGVIRLHEFSAEFSGQVPAVTDHPD